MVLSCHEVWLAISDYIDGDIAGEVRRDMEAHLAQCRHCAALLDSTRNVVVLIADDRVFALPAGFSERLKIRIEMELEHAES